MQLVIDAFAIKKDDGGASRQQFLDNFNRQNVQKQREREAAEAYKQDWIRQERARQHEELNRGVARERAAQAAREAERQRLYERAQRIQRGNNAASLAKYRAERRRKAERYATAQRRKNNQGTVTVSNRSSGYADDGLDDLPPPLITVTPETPKRTPKPPTCACLPGWDLTYGICWNYTDGTKMGPGEYPWREECKTEFESSSTLSYDENGDPVLTYNGN